MEEQLLQIKFDWPVRLATKSSSTGQFDHLLWGPGESLPTLKAEPEKMKSLLPGHRSQMPNLIQLVQGTEQALPLYDPVHGSGPGEIVFLAVLPTAMIRYMAVVLAR